MVYVLEPTFVLRIRATVVKRVERDGLHGLSCTKSAGRFSRHATLNSLVKHTLGLSTWVAVNRSKFSGRNDRGRTV